MPRSRTETSTVRRRRQANSVLRSGIDMSASPCGACRSRNLRCVLDSKSGRCSECIAHTRQCDKVLDWKRVEKLERLEANLQAQLEATDLESDSALETAQLYAHEVQRHAEETQRRAQEAHRQFDTLRARKKRLSQQLSLLRNRREDLLSKDLENIEELEALEARETDPAPSALSPLSVSPPGFFDPDFSDDPALWLPAETPRVSQRSL
jgi:hypothetical protein